jgi:hypothetical protein
MKRRAAISIVGAVVASAAWAQSDISMEAQVLDKARLAVSQFQQRARGGLDYSVKSLSIVEEMLDEASRYASQMPEADRNALVELFGSYILAVAHRAHGGKFYWFEQRKQPILVVGQPNFEVSIITFDKVRGRLSGDKADNIPFFYEGFAARVKNAVPGTKAMYV